ncbi:hypothetical protein FPI77_22305 [Klebsiella quasivariicola]|nr:hypothetical protein [Klebsiella quasivariicola]NBZ77200.1 hypothetical protein [Klebsiella quasivariicola]QBL48153.1 hypothetical protein BMD99_006015 [Klebsiella sp. PO552]TTM52958.1 hypothetical protein FPI77_22305 [Klebsiella quasivariicola]
MASHSVKPKFSRYTQFQPDFIVIGVSCARCRNQRLRHLYPSYFKLHVCWLSSRPPATYLSKRLGFAASPPSCNPNYLGYMRL